MSIASCLNQFGSPAESLTVREVETREPLENEVLIEMLAAPVNPADINVIEGKYGDLPTLPSSIGNEGVGRVLKCGKGVSLAPGQMVLPMVFGTWAQEMVVPAAGVVVLPEGLDPFQAAMLTVNPATAWRTTHDFVPLAPGDWIVQNAANSGVGRSAIQLAKIFGWKTLNVVRRPELVDELKALGADVVVTEETDLRKEVKALTGGAKPKLALNAVGGNSALNIANTLANGGAMVTFGAMSKQPLKIPNALLIFQNIRFCGFWLKRWRERAGQPALQEMYSALAEHMAAGRLQTPVHATFPLARLVDAVEEASKESRGGKVLLDLRKA